MKYYYHKLGTGNNLFEKYLINNKNPIKKPAIAIFYGRLEKKDIVDNKLDNYKAKRQIREFYERSLSENRKETVVIIIYQGKIYFVQPIEELYDYDPGPKEDIYKIVPVKIVKEVKTAEIPSILAGITANAYLYTGTFREITNWGNIKAICSVLNHSLPNEHLLAKNINDFRLLECLGSIELETLIAKIFEANECFVPAHRGGNLKDVDLFIHNLSSKEKNISGLIIPAGKKISIQIKNSSNNHYHPSVDYLIDLSDNNRKKCFGNKWIMDSLINSKSTKLLSWFKNSLNWLPVEFSNHFFILR